jgi:hypothetical protein
VSTLGVRFKQWSQADMLKAAELWRLRTRDSVSDRLRKQGPLFGLSQRPSDGGRTPADVLVKREQRAEAMRLRSPAAEWLNDPPPGYSALDKKRQELTP